MKAKTESDINQYVELYSAIQEKVNNGEVAIVILQEIAKDLRMKEISRAEKSVLATEKQKKLLKDLGIKFSDSITKKDASNLLAEHFGKS